MTTEFPDFDPDVIIQLGRLVRHAAGVNEIAEPALDVLRQHALWLASGSAVARIAREQAAGVLRAWASVQPGYATGAGEVGLAKMVLAGTATVTATANVAGTATANGTGGVVRSAAKPTVAEQFAALSCGERLAVVLVALSVLLWLDLPSRAQDEIAGLIAVIGAAYTVILQIAKKK